MDYFTPSGSSEVQVLYNGTTMSGSVEITIDDDDILELTESFTVRVMEGVSGNFVVDGMGRETVEIQDNEGPSELKLSILIHLTCLV